MAVELQAHVQMESWLRIVAASIMFYDFLITIPSELRLYKRQGSLTRPSLACVFFFLARYVGLAAVISATIVFFHGFQLSSCRRLIYVVGATRSMLSTVVNLIILGRTWVIWGRNRWIGIGMGVALVPCTVFAYGYLFEQVPIVKAGACTALSGVTLLGQKWTFALANMCYDILACALCTIRLVKNIRAEKGIVGISSVLLGDGLGYTCCVVIGNVFGFWFARMRDPARQGSFFTFNVALTSILAQRIITSLYERTATKSASNTSRSRSQGLPSGGRGLPLSPLTPGSPFTPSRNPFLPTPSPISPAYSTYKHDDGDLSTHAVSVPISIGVDIETHVVDHPEKPGHSYAFSR